MADLKKIILNPRDYLITPIPDYFAAKQSEGFSSRTQQTDLFNAGIIEAVGEDLPESRLGKIIYYEKDLGRKVELKGIGNYDMISDAHKVLIRMDQDRNDY